VTRRVELRHGGSYLVGTGRTGVVRVRPPHDGEPASVTLAVAPFAGPERRLELRPGDVFPIGEQSWVLEGVDNAESHRYVVRIAESDEPAPPVRRATTAEGWSMLDTEEIRWVARSLVRVVPLLESAPPREVAAALGWPVVDDRSRSALILDDGLGLGDKPVIMLLEGDRVSSVLVALSSVAVAPGPQARAFKQDGFAAAAQALTAAFGQPAERRAGDPPRITWRVDGVTLQLQPTVTLTLRALPTERADAEQRSVTPFH
jgi:Family of unknown function (DUF6301)/Family of unknown function (DUF6406)